MRQPVIGFAIAGRPYENLLHALVPAGSDVLRGHRALLLQLRKSARGTTRATNSGLTIRAGAGQARFVWVITNNPRFFNRFKIVRQKGSAVNAPALRASGGEPGEPG